MQIEKDGTLHIAVGAGLLVVAGVMLAAWGGTIAALIVGLLGVGILVYGIRRFVMRRTAADDQ